MDLPAQAIFSFDSSALIHAWNRAYRPGNFPSFWAQLNDVIEEGLVVASVEVLAELERKDDGIYKWCRQRASKFSIDIDDEQQTHLRHIMGTYPRLVDTAKGRSGGDPFVIALARVRSKQIVVVSEEDSGKTRIPDVCRAEGIGCKNLADFIEDRKWSF